ncbi:MAG: alpha-1,2-fucosyltransferase [Rickettsiales bacterium]|jgi:hypothetical protein|nr:alpha-1,2-fucosyltransferase [Rickettsiales bacterium]
MNSFIFKIGHGLGDQIRFLKTALEIYRKYGDKYSYYYYLSDAAHGANIMEQYKDLFNIIPLKKIELPKELVQIYEDSFFQKINSVKCLGNFIPPFLFSHLSMTFDIPKDFAEHFNLSIPLPPLVSQKLSQIKSTNNSVCVHIRMGDDLRPGNILLSLSYIRKSLIRMRNKLNANNVNNVTFFIFSNSMDIVKNRLTSIEKDIGGTFDYVNLNQDEQGYFELELMRNCQHFIITQGGFGILASSLCQYPQKIILVPPDKDRIHSQEKKEKEWRYKWDHESNDWRNVKIY